MQSPININTETTIFSPQLRPIQLSGYSLPASQMLALKNNGHTGGWGACYSLPLGFGSKNLL